MGQGGVAALCDLAKEIEAETPDHIVRGDAGDLLIVARQPRKAEFAVGFPEPVRARIDDLAHLVEAYRVSGFRGGFNWYRNIDRNWELTAPWHGAQIHQLALFIAGSNDSVITGLIGAKRVGDMERVVPNLTRKLIIDGAGHWIQQERPAEVNAALIGFLKQVSGA